MKSQRHHRRNESCALIDALEPRQMLNAAVLKNGRLTVYCSGQSDITIGDASGTNPSAHIISVDIQPIPVTGAAIPTVVQFRGTAITRIRVLGEDGADTIQLLPTYTPNLTDVVVYGASTASDVEDLTVAHKFNRGERISIVGGAGNDTLTGGAHTVSIDGGSGDDIISGGEANATLQGGDGNDLLSPNPISLAASLGGAEGALDANQGGALGSVVLNGGAGDDVIVGNVLKTPGISDILSGGSGNDTFYPFSTDQVVDFGVGTDQDLAANQFSGSAQVTQTATLSISEPATPTHTLLPPLNLGDNGPNSRINVSDSQGTLTMQGPAGSTFTLGELFNAAGYPFTQVPISARITLIVNDFVSPLTGNQIARYQINNGDRIDLQFEDGF